MKVLNIASFCLTFVLFVFGSTFAQTSDDVPPATVSNVDLTRFVGRWYEIAAFPKYFQKDCVASKDDYSLREDGDLRVVNTCHKKTLDGEISLVNGTAWVVDSESNSKLKVRFFWPFSEDYWIFEIGKKYEYAVVGSPDRDSLLILSRTPKMSNIDFRNILARATKKGFDVSRLHRTPQIL